ncbi:MAG TPA: serine/threonine-protein kinase [Labilithrix sp.]
MTRRYEPLLKIASGGTAAVYVGAFLGTAVGLGFRQLVAIKRPHAHLADDPQFVASLLEEAKIASRLRHANVVDVRDVESDEDGVDLVMDYVEGASLSDLIRSWKSPEIAVAIRIVLDACEGLRALHDLEGDDGAALGLVHRDVSPANVLVGLDGVGRIADFGLAKPLYAVERTTSEGALRGKLGYMAPEYIRGKKDIDRRIDVFATGVVLWEALARKRLFRGENDGDTLERVQRMAPPKLADMAADLRVRPSVAEELDAVVARALAKDPFERYARMQDLAGDLARVAKNRGLEATPADVRDSFGADLRATLDDRKRRVTSALSGSAPTPSRPPRTSRPPPSAAGKQFGEVFADAPSDGKQLGEVFAGGLTPSTIADSAPDGFSRGAGAIERPRRRASIAIAAIAAIAMSATAFAVTRDAGSARAVDPRSVASDVQSRDDVIRVHAERAISASSASPVTRRALPPDEPGRKAPRPNPYARTSSP